MLCDSLGHSSANGTYEDLVATFSKDYTVVWKTTEIMPTSICLATTNRLHNGDSCASVGTSCSHCLGNYIGQYEALDH